MRHASVSEWLVAQSQMENGAAVRQRQTTNDYNDDDDNVPFCRLIDRLLIEPNESTASMELSKKSPMTAFASVE